MRITKEQISIGNEIIKSSRFGCYDELLEWEYKIPGEPNPVLYATHLNWQLRVIEELKKIGYTWGATGGNDKHGNHCGVMRIGNQKHCVTVIAENMSEAIFIGLFELIERLEKNLPFERRDIVISLYPDAVNMSIVLKAA